MALPPRPKRSKERGGRRGLVPAGTDAHLDVQYASYLAEIKLDTDPVLRNALAASSDFRFRELLRYMMYPSAHKHPLVYWVKNAGIGMEEMMAWMQKAQNARAVAVAQAAAPRINEAMAVDAESRMIACGRCDGLGFVNADEGLPPETPGYRILRMVEVRRKSADGQDVVEEIPVWIRDCPMGCARGKIREPGDEFSREKLLEQSGLINKRGAGVQIVQNFGGQAMPSAVGRLDVMTIDIGGESNPNN